MFKPKLTYANVAATLALVFSMTGGALAAKHYLISSTKQINPKVIAALKGKKGPAGPTGPQGLQGPQGVTGKEGPAGTPATKLWAVISSTATVVKGSGVVSVTKPSTGIYIVKFNRNITQCAFLGTIGAPEFVSVDRGDIDIQGADETTDSLYVETLNNGGTLTDKSFNVGVFC